MLGGGVGGGVVVLRVVAKEWSGESKSRSCFIPALAREKYEQVN
jgi:hypothetical protein